MTSPQQISTKMLATLATTIPGLSCEIGTPERKIVDVVAEAISEAYINQYLIGSILDVDTKTGLELEQFVGIFGFGRLQGQAAVGVVRVTITVPSSTDYSFALGTQFYTTPGLAGVIGTLYYTATQTVVLSAGNLTADVPVQCTLVGSQGNVPPDSVTYLGSAVGGSSVANLGPMTGGVDVETDAELRQRFKDTLLRNIAGTADFYEALCQQNKAVSRVVAYGPLSLYRTQIAVPSSTQPLPVTSDVRYAWPAMMSCFSGLGQESETFYSPLYDYTYQSGTSPTFAPVPGGALTTGQIVDLEFQYTTKCSRNDPLNSITNKVDIFVDGVTPYAVTEQTVVTATPLVSTPSTSPYFTGNFVRIGSSGSPTAGNRFMRLGNVPVVSFPSTLVIGTSTYTRGTDYHFLQSTALNNPCPQTLLTGSQLEISGIEWANSNPPTNTEVTLSYVYNQVPELLNAVISHAKQVTTDVMVHQAQFLYYQPCLSVEYDRYYSVSVINTNIITRLKTYFAQLPFGAQVKLSNIAMYVQQTVGVVDVKLTTSSDNPTSYGIQVFPDSSGTNQIATQTSDFKLADNQLAQFYGVIITRVATP